MDTQGAPGTGTASNDVFATIDLDAGVSGINNNFGEQLAGTASLSGFVYVDANNDGLKQSNEAPIAGVTVTLTGKTSGGVNVSLTTTTNSAGLWSFAGLLAGTYTVTETQPGGYLDGKDTIGTLGGSTSNDKFSNIVLSTGVNGVNNNFGELPNASLLGTGDTATIGFWHNKNGQALIYAVNGGGTSTNLANWLATSFPYLYGASSSNNLAGGTNKAVAAAFLTYFNKTGAKTDAQIMAGALAAYVTNSTLAGGTYAAAYGFKVTTGGTGAKTYNVGSLGTAIGLANNTAYTVTQLLQQANLMKQNGTFNAATFNTIFDGINQKGDII